MTLLDRVLPGEVWDASPLARILPAGAPDLVLAQLAGIPVIDGFAHVQVPGRKGDSGDVAGTLPYTSITDVPAQSYVQPFTNQSTIVVTHGLGRYPAVTVIDTAGSEWETAVTHDSPNQLTISMSFAFSGRVACS